MAYRRGSVSYLKGIANGYVWGCQDGKAPWEIMGFGSGLMDGRPVNRLFIEAFTGQTPSTTHMACGNEIESRYSMAWHSIRQRKARQYCYGHDKGSIVRRRSILRGLGASLLHFVGERAVQEDQGQALYGTNRKHETIHLPD